MENVINLPNKNGKKSGSQSVAVKLAKPLKLEAPQEDLPPLPEYKKPTFFTKTRWKLRMFSERIFDLAIRPVRDRLYRRAGDRLLGELLALAAKLNRPDFHVFVNYSGHVDGITVDVYPGGWNKDDKKVRVLEGPLPGCWKYGKMRPRHIREAMKMLKSLSRLNTATRR